MIDYLKINQQAVYNSGLVDTLSVGDIVLLQYIFRDKLEKAEILVKEVSSELPMLHCSTDKMLGDVLDFFSRKMLIDVHGQTDKGAFLVSAKERLLSALSRRNPEIENT